MSRLRPQQPGRRLLSHSDDLRSVGHLVDRTRGKGILPMLLEILQWIIIILLVVCFLVPRLVRTIRQYKQAKDEEY